MKSKKKLIYFGLITGITGILFYILNYYTPLYFDDYNYAFSLATGERLEEIGQIPASLAVNYKEYNGRIVVHAIAMFYQMIGKGLYNVLHTVCFLLLGYVIAFHTCGKWKAIQPGVLLFVYMALFLAAPTFGQSFLWMTGASNYMYGILLVLLFMIPYRSVAGEVTPEQKSVCKVWEVMKAGIWGIVGLLAGGTNENNGVALIIMLGLFLVYYHKNKISYRFWMFSGILGAFAGMLCMLLSPGSAQRMVKCGGSGSVITWLKRAVSYTYTGIYYFQLLLIVLFVLLVVVYVQYKNKTFLENVKAMAMSGIYFVGFLASVYSLIVVPAFPLRLWSGPLVLLIIMIGNLYYSVSFQDVLPKLCKNVFLGLLVLISLATYMVGYQSVKRVWIKNEARLETLAKEEYAEIPILYGTTKYNCSVGREGDIAADASDWKNETMAKYYGVKEIRGIKQE